MPEPEETQVGPGHYRPTELLEEGPWGALHRAHDTGRDRPVLLKLFPRVAGRDPEFQDYIRRRWQEQKPLRDHPGIVPVVEVGRRKNRYFIATEDPGGDSLAERLRQAPLPTEEVLAVVEQLSEALAAAHERDLVHGHLKPSDIFLSTDREGRPRARLLFMDMGTSTGQSLMSIFGEVRGSPRYLAPEVIRGAAPGPRSDIFSLGVVAYQMATGREPFTSSHPLGYLFANCEQEAAPVREANPHCQPELSRVIARCLEKDPEKRYRSARRLKEDLQRCRTALRTGHVQVPEAGKDSAFSPPTGPEEAPEPAQTEQPGNSRRILLLSLAALLLALAALGLTVALNLPALKARLLGRAPAPASQEELEETALGKPPEEEREAPEDREAGIEQALDRQARSAFQIALADWQRRHSLEHNYELALTGVRDVARRYRDTSFAPRARRKQVGVLYEWGSYLEKKEDYAGAEKKYRRALQLADPDTDYPSMIRTRLPEVLAARAEKLRREQDYEEAIRLLQRIKTEFPDAEEATLLQRREPAIRLAQGLALWKQDERPAGAVEKLEHLVAKYPDSPEAARAREQMPELSLAVARSEFEAGRLQNARERLATLKQKQAETEVGEAADRLDAEVLYALYSRAVQEDNKQQTTILATMLKEHPRSRWTHKALRERVGVEPSAEMESIGTAAATQRYESAQSYFEQGNYAAALSILQRLVKATSTESLAGLKALKMLPECLYRRALNQYGVGKREDCREGLKELMRRFDYSELAERARETLRQMDAAPEGMVYVPEGTFQMGTTRERSAQFLRPFHQGPLEGEDQLDLAFKLLGCRPSIPRHLASTGPFYMDRTEVTNRQYKKFVDATGHGPPPYWGSGSFPEGKADYPVREVTWMDARAYARWAGKELPTESQWEKAARGVDGRQFPWGNHFNRERCHHLEEDEAGPAAVGTHPLGASPYQALDMLGNVWEWTRNTFQPYPGNQNGDQEAPYGSEQRVLRGGSWKAHHLKPIPTRVTYRLPVKPTAALPEVGFRCVKELQ